MFCKNCGIQLDDGVQFCPACGKNQNATETLVINNDKEEELLSTLAEKIRLESYIWVAIGIFQIIIGLSLFNLFTLLIAIWNLVQSSKSLKFAKRILDNPNGIVRAYEPVGGLITFLILNLFIGGVIGVVGSIFGFITRNYVMMHKREFLAMES